MTIQSTYRIYGGELSYFTCKLEATMIFYAARFEMLDNNEHDPQQIEARSGTHQVPVGGEIVIHSENRLGIQDLSIPTWSVGSLDHA